MNRSENDITRQLFMREQGRREAERRVLENTEGFKLLTARQQRIIKLALYIQKRAERQESSFGDKRRRYMSSDAVIHANYCFGAIQRLEREQGMSLEKAITLPDLDFFDAKLEFVSNFKQLRQLAEVQRFPSVGFVSFAREKVNVEGGLNVCHAFLSLGHDMDNELVVFDKEGSGIWYPFRLVLLSELYGYYSPDTPHEYGKGFYWGFRKLRNRDSFK